MFEIDNNTLIKTAYIYGNIGVAIFEQKDNEQQLLLEYDLETGNEKLRKINKIDLMSLINNDSIQIKNILYKELKNKLIKISYAFEALSCFLNGLDNDLTKETRLYAIELCEILCKEDDTIIDFIEDRLIGYPLNDDLCFNDAILISKKSKIVHELYNTIFSLKKLNKIFHQSFNEIMKNLKYTETHKKRILKELIETGMIAILIKQQSQINYTLDIFQMKIVFLIKDFLNIFKYK